MKTKLIIFLCLIGGILKAQDRPLQFYRPNNQQGINTFETSKKDTIPFSGLNVKIGGNFDMTFQSLRAHNRALPLTRDGYTGNVNSLMKLTEGFELPMANLNVDVQLADGVRMNLTSYLATRHHEDTWVKGGYIQFDKLPFLHNELIDAIMKSFTIRIGQTDIDYGDQHYRRTDGGNTIYNPFVENYIMDEFATEIGAEIYYHHPSGIFLMGGISNGELDPVVNKSTKIDAATGETNRYSPAFHGKIGFDKQVNSDFRIRLTGSFYTLNSANNNTLFGGDRAGSHYFNVMQSQAIYDVDGDYTPFSGRLNPGFTEEVHTYMGNLFLKYKGLEFFGTAEDARGRTITETVNRKSNQYAGDLIYRFPANKENFWLGARYNTVKAALKGYSSDITINRAAGSFGWFLSKNIMAKMEYVSQNYKGYPVSDILNGGKFRGIMIEASIGF